MWGTSTTSTVPNPDTGVPTRAPFLWDHEKMIDLGTLGGTFGFAQCANRRRQVIGLSSLAGTPIACTDGRLTGCHASCGKTDKCGILEPWRSQFRSSMDQ